MVLFLLGIFLIFPIISAQEQTETYSGFDRFIDNIRMFFSSGDTKVMLALEIREKEFNSAIANTENGNNEEAERNLNRARQKLQYIQEKVSKDIAEDVKANVNDMLDEISENENLPEDFDLYVLEEEKTQLTAELVVEIEGKEGQILTREIVKDIESGENKVKIVVEGDGSGENKVGVEGQLQEQIQEQNRTREIETRINNIDKEIANSIVIEKQKTKDNEDVSPAPNIVDDDVAPGPQGIVGDQGYSDDEGHHGDVPSDTSGASGEVDED